MSCVSCHMSHVTFHISHVTCHMSHVTCHMSHITCQMSQVTWHISHVTCHMLHVMGHMSCDLKTSSPNHIVTKKYGICNSIYLPRGSKRGLDDVRTPQKVGYVVFFDKPD